MEVHDRFSVRSLGKACFHCIAHAGTHITTQLRSLALHRTQMRPPHTLFSGYVCSCVSHKQTKTSSPKILRGGRPSHTCAILFTNMLYAVQTSYRVHLSVHDMFCMCYSTISFGRNALEKSRPRKTPHLINQRSSWNRSGCTEIANMYSIDLHCVLVCIGP